MLTLLAFQDAADQTIRIEIQTSLLSQVLTWLIAGARLPPPARTSACMHY